MLNIWNGDERSIFIKTNRKEKSIWWWNVGAELRYPQMQLCVTLNLFLNLVNIVSSSKT